MRALLLGLLFAVPAFGHGKAVSAHEPLVVNAYMHVGAGHCYNSADELVELANQYAGRRTVSVNVHAVGHHDQVVQFARVSRQRVKNVRNVRFRVVRARSNRVFVRGRPVVVGGSRTVVVVQNRRRSLFERIFGFGFGRQDRVIVENGLDRVIVR